LTHDTRAPEIERALHKTEPQARAIKVDQAYATGGFDLMRRVIEDATGLSVDFQVAFKDTVIQTLTDEVFGSIQVDVPSEFDVWEFYLEGRKYEVAHFAKGPQKLNGVKVIQFIKAIEGTYDKSLERNVRKVLVFRGILDAVSRNCRDYSFWWKFSGFLARQAGSHDVAFDFDPLRLLVSNLGTMLPNLGRIRPGDESCGISMSRIRQSKYIVDAMHGDGGVQWVTVNANYNDITRADIEQGVYLNSGEGYEVPMHANPYGDLLVDYWSSVRTLVKDAIAGDVK
jgi:hypothetical protein